MSLLSSCIRKLMLKYMNGFIHELDNTKSPYLNYDTFQYSNQVECCKEKIIRRYMNTKCDNKIILPRLKSCIYHC